MEADLTRFVSKVNSGELQTHDEIRRSFLDIVEQYLDENYGLLVNAKMERDVGDGYYDARVGNLYFEIKRPSDGIQAGIDDSQEYICNESEAPPDFFTTEGTQAAHINPQGNVIQGPDTLPTLAARLQTLLDAAVSSPTSQDIVDAFGPRSSQVQTYIELLWNVLQEHNNLTRVDNAFETWKNIYAESANLSSGAQRAVERQARDYGLDVSSKDDSYAFLFVVQTYFSIFLKLFSGRLAGAYPSAKGRVTAGVWPDPYRRLSLGNEVIEHDLFDWFIEPARTNQEASAQLEDMVVRIASSVDTIDPESIDVDVLRQLYQNSFDSETRKAMGEFYTNDDLVEEVLDSIGYEGEEILGETLLDPTCGSGTFLFHAIGRYRDAAKSAGLNDVEIVNGVTSHINGIDLHPFAVAMARTNYLLSLGESAQYAEEVPVYWTDSLAPASQRTLSGLEITVSTLGSVEIPNPADIDPEKIFRRMEDALVANWSKERFLGEFDEEKRHIYEVTLSELYQFFSQEITDGMWVPAFRDVAIIRELEESCRYLVGNPLWVRRRNVESDLRGRLDENFEFYSGAWRPELDQVRTYIGSRDYSLAFLEAGIGFLEDDGDLGLVITSNFVRSLYAGTARNKLINNTTAEKLVDYSFSSKNLFEDAENVPLIIALSKTQSDSRDVNVELFNRTDDRLTWNLQPGNMSLERDDASSPWMFLPPNVLQAVRTMQNGNSRLGDIYSPMRGIMTSANSMYFVEGFHATDTDDEIVVETQAGETVRIEADLVHPLIRGRNIDAWSFEVDDFILWPHDENGEVRNSLPSRAEQYFGKHENRLKSRADYDEGDPIWKIFRSSVGKLEDKVAWQMISKSIESARLPSKVDTDVGERHLIVDHGVYFLKISDRAVASQLAALLNSAVARSYTAGYVNKTGGRYCQHFSWILGVLPVPEKIVNGEAKRLEELSEKLHGMGTEDEALQRELDEEVAELYGLSDKELEGIREFLEFFIR